jgi:hypothetical protein
MPSSPPGFLDHLAAKQHAIAQWTGRYQGLADALDAAYLSARGLPQTSVEGLNLTRIQAVAHGFWQTAADYQIQSIEHLCAGELDAGMAILRMSTELARDAVVISRDPKNLELWNDREDRRREYQQTFKFDHGTSDGKRANELYTLTTQFGVHGHSTSFIDAKPSPSNPGMLSVSPRMQLKCISVWFAGLAPVDGLFLRSLKINSRDYPTEYKRLLELLDAVAALAPAWMELADAGDTRAH